MSITRKIMATTLVTSALLGIALAAQQPTARIQARRYRYHRVVHRNWNRRYHTGCFHHGVWHHYATGHFNRYWHWIPNQRRVYYRKRTRRAVRIRKPRRSYKRIVNGIQKRRRTVPTRQDFLSQIKSQTFEDINKDREANGVSPLTKDHQLDQLANIRARQASTNFSHVNSNGEPYATIDAPQVGLPSDFECSENLADDYGNTGAEVANNAENEMMYHDAASGWGHRDNILDSGANYVGIGAAPVTSGNYAGDYTIAEDFIANADNQQNNTPENLNSTPKHYGNGGTTLTPTYSDESTVFDPAIDRYVSNPHFENRNNPNNPNNSNNDIRNLSQSDINALISQYKATHDNRDLVKLYGKLVEVDPSNHEYVQDFADAVNGSWE